MNTPAGPGAEPPPTRVRHGVLAFLCVMAFILYLDRICISQAVSLIERDLGISHTAMGFVLGAFTLAYGLFEVPTGHWGDRYGSRTVLTRIVWWWSAFTMLTGLATGFVTLVVVRFLFGAGEAGALPNTARVLARWFPAGARGPAQGTILMCALLGGAVSPIISEGLMSRLGWRGTFLVLGIPGILWGLLFWWWYRDSPSEHPGVNTAERTLIDASAATPNTTSTTATTATIITAHPPIPWSYVLRQANIWLLGGIVTCCAFTTYLFFSWYPTYLQQGRGVSSGLSSWLASSVLLGGAIGSLCGGYLGDWLVRRTGERKWSRRLLGFVSLTSASAAMVVSIFCSEPWLAAGCAAWACFAVHLQLPNWWGAVTDISGPHLGALFGLMNALGVPGAVGSQLFLGRFADALGEMGYTGQAQWDPAFYIYAGVLMIGAVSWLFVDATRPAVKTPTEPGDTP